MKSPLPPRHLGRYLFLIVFLIGIMVIVSSLSAQENSLSAPEKVEPPATPPYLLQMIRDDSVHLELRLTDEQIKQVDGAIAEVDPRWWVSRIMPAEQQKSEIHELTVMLQERLKTFLDSDNGLDSGNSNAKLMARE